ncbi:MAG: protein kinase domain-containing protein [Planctomycetota bacterium]
MSAPRRYLQSPESDSSKQRALFFAETVEQGDETVLRQFGATIAASHDTTCAAGGDAAPDLERVGPGRGDAEPRYQIMELLGRGGGGSVYAVEDRHLQRRVALKALRSNQSDKPDRIAGLGDEARVTAGLEHPNILPVYDLGSSADGRLFFTMREAPGRNLLALIDAARLGEEVPIIATWQDCVEIMLKVCDATRYAHDRGIVHRDIKPANIVIGDFGEVLLVDWGTATHLDDARKHTGLFGTPMYMAPEQARQEAIDQRSDIYCLGTTLFHLLIRRYPLLEGNSSRFWEKKRRGYLDRLDPESGRSIPSFLLEIVIRAVDPEPERRYQQVEDLAADLRRYQRHQASIERCDAAAQQLGAVRDVPRHHDFNRIAAQIEQALELWPANQRAARLGRRCAWHHARFALERDELELARDLLDAAEPDHAALLLEIESRWGQLRRRRRWSRWLGWSLAAVGLILVVIGIQVWREYHRHFGAWQLVDEWRFEATGSTDGLVLWHQGRDEAVPIAADRQGLHPDPTTVLWVAAPQHAPDLRLTAEVSWQEHIDGVEFLLHNDRQLPALWWQVPRGYSAQFGAYQNVNHYISINNEDGMPSSLYGVPSRLQPDRRYHLSMEIEDAILRLRVDGEIVLERAVPIPVSDPALSHCGIRLWSGEQTNLHSLRLERLSLPLRTSPLAMPDQLLGLGMTKEAVAGYDRLARDYPDTDLEARALARAWLAARQLPPEQRPPPATSADWLARLEQRHPAAAGIRAIHEQQCLELASAGHIDAAVQAVHSILARWPESRVALTVLDRIDRARLDTDQGQRLLGLAVQTQGLTELDLGHMQLTDLEPVRGLPLRRLTVDYNSISDLSPLRGMPLVALDISDNRISDLTALLGMQLHGLDVSDNLITDISPLRGMQLERLALSDNMISDLSPLHDMPLVNLRAAGNRIRDLEPLRGMPLQKLDVGRNRIADLSPLSDLPLAKLECDDNLLNAWAPLPASLRVLEAGANAFTQGPPPHPWLKKLYLSGSRIDDCGFVTQLPALVDLDIGHTRIGDITALEHLPLIELNLDGLTLPQIAVLTSMPSLRSCTLRESRIDLEQLHAGPPATDIRLDHRMHSIDDLTTLLRAWQKSHPDHPSTRNLAKLVVVLQGDGARARQLAASVDGLRVLSIEGPVSITEARQLAEACAARLPLPSDIQPCLAAQLDLPFGFWSPARSSEGVVRWPDGQAVPAHLISMESEPPAADCGYLWLRALGWQQIRRAQSTTRTSLVLVWDQEPMVADPTSR